MILQNIPKSPFEPRSLLFKIIWMIFNEDWGWFRILITYFKYLISFFLWNGINAFQQFSQKDCTRFEWSSYFELSLLNIVSYTDIVNMLNEFLVLRWRHFQCNAQIVGVVKHAVDILEASSTNLQVGRKKHCVQISEASFAFNRLCLLKEFLVLL